MRHILLSFIIVVCSTTALAQDPAGAGATDASKREALLKAAVARDRGDISVMEPVPGDGRGVVLGYSSGAVLQCYGNHSCIEFSGTPNLAVEHIAISKREKSEIVWVSYPQGALYRCVGDACSKFIWRGSQGE